MVENLARVGPKFELDQIQANSSQEGGQAIAKLNTWLELGVLFGQG